MVSSYGRENLSDWANTCPDQSLSCYILHIRVCNLKLTFLFLSKRYVVGTQNNCLDETQNTLKLMGKKIIQNNRLRNVFI